MANILKVTTPVGGYDNTANVRTNPELQNPVNVQGPVNPEKITRPDARSDAASQQDEAALKFKYETNFDQFIQQLRNMPSLAEELPKLLQEYSGMLAESGINKDFAQEISQFLSMINATPEKMTGLLKNQSMAALRFTGAFFNLLRQVMGETKSIELKNSILTFLKRYTDMAESGTVLKDIQRDLKEVTNRMFQQQKEQAQNLAQGLKEGGNLSPGERAENLRLLKTEILPYLNRYVSQTHDRGILRDATAHIADLISRYENGQPAGVLQAFERLMDFQAFQRYFEGFDPSRLFEILANTEFERASGQNPEMDRLAELIAKGASGEAGIESKQVFQQIMKAIVLNESVYMPVLHLMLPVCVDGKMLFSEMWVDPDAENGKEKEEGSRERTIRGLVKFDIQDVGFFDLFFLCGGEKVSLQINLPDTLDGEGDKIQEDIHRILQEHSLEAEEIVIGKSTVPIPITDAFPNLKERKNSINVSI